jgi:peptidoglycan/LPS O-acetylase OafA/YrhL
VATPDEQRSTIGAVQSRVSLVSRFPCFDGLRAIAALAVLTYHSVGIVYAQGSLSAPHWILNWISRLGLFGVAVFFVISGFLLYRPFAIAALADRPAPRWLPFWKRRFCRIFPAYWVALAVSVYLLGFREFTTLTESIFQFGLLQNYRGQYLRNGLGVAWTLVIEVSFYAVLPFLALLLRVLQRTARSLNGRVGAQLCGLALIATCGLAVRVWMLWGSGHSPSSYGEWFPSGAVTFWLPSFFDWFALGMALAVASAWLGEGRRLPGVVAILGDKPWLSWLLAIGSYWLVTQLGLGLFVASTAFTPTQAFLRFAFTGVSAAFFVAPAVLGVQNRGWIRSLLRTRVAVALGLVSYGIYLWHFPVWDQVLELRADTSFLRSAVVQIGVVLVVTVLVASLSYVVIERPIISLASGRSPFELRPLLTEVFAPRPVRDRLRDREIRTTSPVRIVAAVSLTGLALVGVLIGRLELHGATRATSAVPDTYRWSREGAQVWDDFRRSDQAGLGLAPTGQAWNVLSGSWSVENDRAVAAAAASRSVAIVDTAPAAALHLRAVLGPDASQGGVAFRCADIENCWTITAVPAFGTWSVQKVVGGRPTLVGNLGVVSSRPGTNVAVHLRGDRIRISVDGVVRKVIVDNSLVDADGVGLARGSGETQLGSWSEFEVSTSSGAGESR